MPTKPHFIFYRYKKERLFICDELKIYCDPNYKMEPFIYYGNPYWTYKGHEIIKHKTLKEASEYSRNS